MAPVADTTALYGDMTYSVSGKDGKFSAGFAGAGVKAGKNITLKDGQTLHPFLKRRMSGLTQKLERRR